MSPSLGIRIYGPLAEMALEALEQCRSRSLLDMDEEEARFHRDLVRLGHLLVPENPSCCARTLQRKALVRPTASERTSVPRRVSRDSTGVRSLRPR